MSFSENKIAILDQIVANLARTIQGTAPDAVAAAAMPVFIIFRNALRIVVGSPAANIARLAATRVFIALAVVADRCSLMRIKKSYEVYSKI